jgi:cytochrome P450
MTATPAEIPAEIPTIYSAALTPDPYPVYRWYRENRPTFWDGGSWVLTRYADVRDALREPRLIASRIHPDEAWLEETGLGPLFKTHARMMLFVDAPDHTRLRGLVNKAFTPRTVESMRANTQALVDGMLDAAVKKGELDIIHDLAYPLPVTVIATLLGVPVEERDQFRTWSEGVAGFIGGTNEPEPEMMARALKSVVEMRDYFLHMAADRRKNPRDDMLTALALAEEQGDRLNSEELVANCILLMVAGHETTTNLIGNGLLLLLRRPEERRRLGQNPQLIGTAVEEILRYDSPVQGTSRMAGEDLEIGGARVQKGQHVSLMIGAANHDDAQFADAERFDVGRADNRHLSFSHGAHFCVGAALARMEGQIAIGTLLQRLPNLRLTDAPLTWRNNYTLRGLTSLPVGF